ncbi:hypothetical protein U6B65_00900 [Oscillospiraceae bacterium MB08-C2-2]|nr:hypothetical protein U6B65_00900 [Oscillospiraceae bacterium MB08-C2-2]
MKRLFGLALAIVLVCSPLQVWASVTYQGSLQQLQADRQLFSLEGMLPGSSETRSVILQNRSTSQLLFYLKATPSHFTDSADANRSLALLEALQMKITLHEVNSNGSVVETGKLLYEGPASGRKDSGSIHEYIPLGTLRSWQQSVLEITVTLPTNIGNEQQNVLASLDWGFYCTVFTGSGGDRDDSDRDSDKGSTLSTITILDQPVPLGTIEILDNKVPTSIPNTGLRGHMISPAWVALSGLIALLALFWRQGNLSLILKKRFNQGVNNRRL